jgi:NAD(P)-dependent dehydrogenase (short-subunit alcohol dehydrogenase family)
VQQGRCTRAGGLVVGADRERELVAAQARSDGLAATEGGDAAGGLGQQGVADAVAVACAGLRARWGGIDLVLWVAGTYQAMRAQDFELEAARRMLDTNLVSVFSGLSAILPVLIAQGSGGIALVSSVAGYSGLPQALVYGPTKAAMINLAESLYLDLRPAGIGVYLINPGYVDTPATAGNDYAMPGLISAREAADFTLAGIEAGHFEVHYPKRFTLWLKFARLLPYRLYFALVRRVTGS